MTHDEMREALATAIRLVQDVQHALAFQANEQPEMTLNPENHPLVGAMVTISRGQHTGKYGLVTDVRPSKFNDGMCAIIEHKGVRIYANTDYCQPANQPTSKPTAPSVRRPVARKANGSLPW